MNDGAGELNHLALFDRALEFDLLGAGRHDGFAGETRSDNEGESVHQAEGVTTEERVLAICVLWVDDLHEFSGSMRFVECHECSPCALSISGTRRPRRIEHQSCQRFGVFEKIAHLVRSSVRSRSIPFFVLELAILKKGRLGGPNVFSLRLRCQ